MTEPAPTPPPRGRIRPIGQLRTSGMLWLINRVVFHPRGLALQLHTDGNGHVTGWSLTGDGSEVWTYPVDSDDAGYADAQRTLAEHTTSTRPKDPR